MSWRRALPGGAVQPSAMSGLALAALAASTISIATGKELQRGLPMVDATAFEGKTGASEDLGFCSDGSSLEAGCSELEGRSNKASSLDHIFKFAPPPPLIKCIMAAVVGSLFAIAGMVLERPGEESSRSRTISAAIPPTAQTSTKPISMRKIGGKSSPIVRCEADVAAGEPAGECSLRSRLMTRNEHSDDVIIGFKEGQEIMTMKGREVFASNTLLLQPGPRAEAKAPLTSSTRTPGQFDHSRAAIAKTSLEAPVRPHFTKAAPLGDRDSPVGASKLEMGIRSSAIVEPGVTFGRNQPAGNSGVGRDRNEVERVVRQVKSILNKLTRQTFDKLYAQLRECFVESEGRDEIILVVAQEVFAKATMEQSFVEMYADVCAKLSEDLRCQGGASKIVAKSSEKGKNVEKANITLDVQADFRRALLEQCQKSFHLYLDPPRIRGDLGYEEQYEELVKFKTKMLGNVRLIGHLLNRNILSAKIIFLCTEELIRIASPEALETLCVFLLTIGPTFDTPKWQGYSQLDKVFKQTRAFAEAPGQTTRIQCLVKDLLQQRKHQWQEEGQPKRWRCCT